MNRSRRRSSEQDGVRPSTVDDCDASSRMDEPRVHPLLAATLRMSTVFVLLVLLTTESEF